MPLPSVAVVIPCKDDAVALERCLRLLAAQTVAPAEVVVVDNGSTDDSAAVARRHGARVVPEPVPGIPAAASAGYDAVLAGADPQRSGADPRDSATADVVARCDADSAPPSDWVERIAAAFGSDPRLDALTGTGTFYDLGPRVEPWLRALYLGSYYALVHAALAHPPLWGSNMAMRAGVWADVRDRVERVDAEVHDDIDLAFALGPSRRIHYDRTLRVGVSARSMRGGAQLRRRFRRAFRTLRAGWRRQDPPWELWRTRLRTRPPGRWAAPLPWRA